jgi:hypothetical protein
VADGPAAAAPEAVEDISGWFGSGEDLLVLMGDKLISGSL